MLKITWYMDNKYKVYDYVEGYTGNEKALFIGSLADCEAYIRLKEKNILE